MAWYVNNFVLLLSIVAFQVLLQPKMHRPLQFLNVNMIATRLTSTLEIYSVKITKRKTDPVASQYPCIFVITCERAGLVTHERMKRMGGAKLALWRSLLPRLNFTRLLCGQLD